MYDKRALAEDCSGRNRKTWADALEFAVSRLPDDLTGRTVLEIGASGHSTLAPLFSAMGADVTCSCYGPRKEEVEDGRLRMISKKYNLRKARVVEMNAYDIADVHDFIVLKSVLVASAGTTTITQSAT